MEIDYNNIPITLIADKLKHLHFLNLSKEMLLKDKYKGEKKYIEEDIEYHTKGLNDIEEEIKKLNEK